MKTLKSKNGFFSLAAILITLVIVCVLGYLMFDQYLKPSATIDEKNKAYIQEQNIDTSTTQSVLETTKKRIHDMEKQELDRSNDVLDMMKGNRPIDANQ